MAQACLWVKGGSCSLGGFSCLGALPIVSSTELTAGDHSTSTWACLCCGRPASVAGTEGTHSRNLVVGSGLQHHYVSLCGAKCYLLPCRQLFPFTSCYRVYLGPKVNEERRWVRPIIWRLGLPCDTCHGSPKAMSSFQGEPQSLATIFQLVSQACESAIESK